MSALAGLVLGLGVRLAFLLFAVLLLAAPAHSASVLSVGDGDTITVNEFLKSIQVNDSDNKELTSTPSPGKTSSMLTLKKGTSSDDRNKITQ